MKVREEVVRTVCGDERQRQCHVPPCGAQGDEDGGTSCGEAYKGLQEMTRGETGPESGGRICRQGPGLRTVRKKKSKD